MQGMSTPTPSAPATAAAPAAAAVAPPAPQPVTHRAAFDELLRRRIYALVAAAPADEPARREALSDVQLLEASAREFADAVDRDGRNIDYADAVFITGSQRPLVVTITEYKHTPFYWEALAGEVDGLTKGAELVATLTGE